MEDQERKLLQAVLNAATLYVGIVNNPPLVPRHKAGDGERQAFAVLEATVEAALAGVPPSLKTFVEPDDEGAWS